MSTLLIQAGGIVTGGRVQGRCTVTVASGRIAGVDAGHDIQSRHGEPVLDASGLTLVPGMIDLHTHGANGAHAGSGTTRDLARMAEFYAAHGVTGFLASVGGDQESIEAGLGAVAAFAADEGDGSGARCLGASGRPVHQFGQRGCLPARDRRRARPLLARPLPAARAGLVEGPDHRP